jgi:hypothetical protein
MTSSEIHVTSVRTTRRSDGGVEMTLMSRRREMAMLSENVRDYW